MVSQRYTVGMAILTAGLVLSACAPRGTQTPAAQTAQVVSLTAKTTVDVSGAIQPQQTASVFWKTTGQVADVKIKVGDRVKVGDPLMTLDPASAPQSLIQAAAEVIADKKALNDLQHPSELTIANAKKAVADAQKDLEDKQRTLKNTVAPDVSYYQDQFNRAQQKLTAAQQTVEITNFQTSVRNAKDALDQATNDLNKYKDLEAKYPGYGQLHGDILTKTQKIYDRAVQDYQAALYNLQQAQANNGNSVKDAQDALTTAQANLASAQAGPDSVKRAQAEADVAVAQAKVADNQAKLQDMLNGGNADDVAAAQAKLAAAQATVNALTITAPFNGEVMDVKYLAGDPVEQTTAAVVLADRTRMHVDVSVDESDVTALKVGNPAAVTFDSLPEINLSGTVSEINAVGETVQGLVRYSVRVDLEKSDPRVLLGMTANVSIITSVKEGALAVPFKAVQLDAQGEYVNRMTAGGVVERVPVVSRQTQGDQVIVEGGLKAGDVIELPAVKKTTTGGGPFGG